MSLPTPFYSQDGITIYCGDNRHVLPSLGKFDAFVTDTPYGVNLGNHAGANEKRPGYLLKGSYAGYDDTPDNYAKCVAPLIEYAIRVCTRGAVFGIAPSVWNLPPPSAIGGVYIPAGCGRTCWGFQNLAPVLFYGIAPELNKGAKNTMLRSSASSEKSDHPCPKPIEWMTWLLGLVALAGESIVDPFMGSGTTLVAAKLRGLKAVGIEINEEYCKIAVERLRQGVLIAV